MNCAVHTDVPAVAYCRTCGKALCATCKHDVRGVIYCEDCIASRLHDTMPAGAPAAAMPVAAAIESGPNPAIAAFLGFIPGVGAMYNGQFVKGLIHVGIFASLVWGADHAGSADVFFGFGIAFWIFYMVFDAYRTARALRMGEVPPDPFGFERLWGGSTRPVGMPVAPMPGAVPMDAAVAADAEMQASSRPPVGAFILIGLGVLFLLNTLNIFHWHWIGRFWPVILIVLGVWTWMKRSQNPPGAN